MLYVLYRSHDDDTATLRQPLQEKAEEDAHSITSYFLFLNCFFLVKSKKLYSLIQVTNVRLNQFDKISYCSVFCTRTQASCV